MATSALVQLLIILATALYAGVACFREPGNTKQFALLGLLLAGGFFWLLTRFDGVQAEDLLFFRATEFYVGMPIFAGALGFVIGAVLGWIGSVIRRMFRRASSLH